MATDDAATFGATLRRLRVAAGLSLRAAASSSGVSLGYLCHIERGVRPPPSLALVMALARVVGDGRGELVRLALHERGDADTLALLDENERLWAAAGDLQTAIGLLRGWVEFKSAEPAAPCRVCGMSYGHRADCPVRPTVAWLALHARA